MVEAGRSAVPEQAAQRARAVGEDPGRAARGRSRRAGHASHLREVAAVGLTWRALWRGRRGGVSVPPSTAAAGRRTTGTAQDRRRVECTWAWWPSQPCGRIGLCIAICGVSVGVAAILRGTRGHLLRRPCCSWWRTLSGRGVRAPLWRRARESTAGTHHEGAIPATIFVVGQGVIAKWRTSRRRRGRPLGITREHP
jgi:hypothetical protein